MPMVEIPGRLVANYQVADDEGEYDYSYGYKAEILWDGHQVWLGTTIHSQSEYACFEAEERIERALTKLFSEVLE